MEEAKDLKVSAPNADSQSRGTNAGDWLPSRHYFIPTFAMFNPNAINRQGAHAGAVQFSLTEIAAAAAAEDGLPEAVLLRPTLAPWLRVDASELVNVSWESGPSGLGRALIVMTANATPSMRAFDVVRTADGSTIVGHYDHPSKRFFAIDANGEVAGIFHPTEQAGGGSLWRQRSLKAGPTLASREAEGARFCFSLIESAWRDFEVVDLRERVLETAAPRATLHPSVKQEDLHEAWALLTEFWDPRLEADLHGAIRRLSAYQLTQGRMGVSSALTHLRAGFDDGVMNEIDLRDRLAMTSSSRAWFASNDEVVSRVRTKLCAASENRAALDRAQNDLEAQVALSRRSLMAYFPALSTEVWAGLFERLQTNWSRDQSLLLRGFVPVPGLGHAALRRDLIHATNRNSTPQASAELAEALLARQGDQNLMVMLGGLRDLHMRALENRAAAQKWNQVELYARHLMHRVRSTALEHEEWKARQTIWSEMDRMFSALPPEVSGEAMTAVLVAVVARWVLEATHNRWANCRPSVCPSSGLPELLNELVERQPDLEADALDHFEDVMSLAHNIRSIETIRHAVYVIRLLELERPLLAEEFAAIGHAMAPDQPRESQHSGAAASSKFLLSALGGNVAGPPGFSVAGWLEMEQGFAQHYLDAISRAANVAEAASGFRREIEERFRAGSTVNDLNQMLEALAQGAALTRALIDHLGEAAKLDVSVGMALSMMDRRRSGEGAIGHVFSRWRTEWQQSSLAGAL